MNARASIARWAISILARAVVVRPAVKLTEQSFEWLSQAGMPPVPRPITATPHQPSVKQDSANSVSVISFFLLHYYYLFSLRYFLHPTPSIPSSVFFPVISTILSYCHRFRPTQPVGTPHRDRADPLREADIPIASLHNKSNHSDTFTVSCIYRSYCYSISINTD